MPRDISRETRIHLALWRRALHDDGLTITLQSYSQALSMRLAMYRALKPYRHNEFLDPELTEASNKYCIAVSKDSGILQIANRKSLLAAEAAMEQLGLCEADLYSPEEQAIQARMLSELDKLDLIEVEPPEPTEQLPEAPNTFFSRD